MVQLAPGLWRAAASPATGDSSCDGDVVEHAERADLVPAFVNPLVVTLAVLCLTLVGVTAAARVRRAGDVLGQLAAER